MSAGAQRIAFVAPRYPEGPTVGGAETLLKQLAIRAAGAGRDVTVLTTCARNHFTWENEIPAGAQQVDGLALHRFPVDADRDLDTFFRVQNDISRGARVSRDEERAWMANNINSTPLYDHLHTHGAAYDRIVMGPYLFGLIVHAAGIHPDRTLLVPCLHDEVFAYLETVAEMFQAVRGFMFNTVPERDLAARLYTRDFTDAAVVGMGLDPFETDPDAFRERHALATPFLLYAGRREPLKGTPLLVDYLAAFRSRTEQDIKLVCTGTGPIDPPPELAPHVTDLGFVAEQEKHDAMAAALAFCHPSVNESLGIVLLESWLARTPVLVHAGSRVLADQCRRSNGGLWFRNYPEFETQLTLLLDRTKVRTGLGNAGHDYVEREYAWPAIEQRLLTALDR